MYGLQSAVSEGYLQICGSRGAEYYERNLVSRNRFNVISAAL
jgi:hypothetical protein